MCYQLCGVTSVWFTGWCKQMDLVVKVAPQESSVEREVNFNLNLNNFACWMSLFGEKRMERNNSEFPYIICFSKVILTLKSPYGNHFLRKE